MFRKETTFQRDDPETAGTCRQCASFVAFDNGAWYDRSGSDLCLDGETTHEAG